MKKISIPLLILYLFLLLPLPTSANETKSIIINEVMPNPLGSDTDYEWVELYNPTDNAINLSGWIIDGKTISEGVVEPNSYLIVAKNKTKLLELFPTITNVIQVAISLGNSGEELKLEYLNYVDNFQYLSSNENISIERINYCSNDILESIDNHTISKENSVYEPDYCSASDAPEIEFVISRNDLSINNIFEAFVNENVVIQLDGEIESIISTDWYIDGQYYSSQQHFDNTFLDTKEYLIEAKILVDETYYLYQTNLNILPKVFLNEVMANPVGSDSGNEWIELYVDSSNHYDLSGWIISNKSTSMKISNTSTNYPIIVPTFSLTNTVDTLVLYTPAGIVSDEFDYTNAPEGQSFSREIDGTGTWSQKYEITKGDTNRPIFQEVLSLGQIRDSLIGEKYSTKGQITVDINILGENIFYIQDTTSGIKIKNNSDLLSLDQIKTGVEVQIFNAQLNESNEELYLLISDDTELTYTFNKNEILPIQIEGNIEKYEGMLIEIHGEITKNAGTTFYVSQNNIEYKISISKGTNIKLEKSLGDKVEIQGIFSQYGFLESGEPNYRILPRMHTDVRISPKIKTVSTKSTSKPKVISATKKSISQQKSNWVSLEISKQPQLKEIEGNNLSTSDSSSNTNQDYIVLKGISMFSMLGYSVIMTRSKWHLIKFI